MKFMEIVKIARKAELAAVVMWAVGKLMVAVSERIMEKF